MSATIIDGRHIAQQIQEQIQQDIIAITKQGYRAPGLAVIMVGDDPASKIYVRNKEKACESAGIRSWHIALPATTSQADLLARIDELNLNNKVDGILLQLPLPEGLKSNECLERIHPKKDVDGFHPYNLGRLAQRLPTLRPCTPYGVMRLLAATQIEVKGLHAVVVGSSNIVGRPMVLELLNAGATVTNCHRMTHNLQSFIEQADLIVVAIGQPDVIKSQWIKPGAIVIDVGINRNAQGKLVGDIDFASACQRAKYITPVPGGVGPMTIAMLLENTVRSYQMQVLPGK